MSNTMRWVAATSLGVVFIAVVVSVAQESPQVPVSERASSPVPESRPDEREEIAKRITASDLNPDSKLLYERLVMQPEAWRSGLVENLGLSSIVGPKHDPKRVRQVFRSFELADSNGEKYKVFLADRSALRRKRVRSTYIVTDHRFALIAWQWTPIDGELVLKTKLQGDSFPAVLQLSEASRHNGDVGHFEFRLAKRGIEGIRNGFGGRRWPPSPIVLKRRVKILEQREQQLIDQLRSFLPLPDDEVEKVCSELAQDAKGRREQRAEREQRGIDIGPTDSEDMRVALSASVDRFEQEVQELSSAERDAFHGRLERLLQLSIQRGLLESVKIAAAAGADVNRAVGSGSAPLHEAMFSMIAMPLQTRIIEALIQAGADPNETIAEGEKGGAAGGRSPLMAVLNHRHPPLLKALLDGGADCNVTDRIGRNALHLLAHSPHFQESPAMARLLIEAGCDVNNADNHGETVMHVAVMSAASYPDGIEHSLRFLRLILDQQPDLSLRDKHGYRALQSKRKHHVPQDFKKILASLRDHEVAKPWIESKDQ